MSILDRAHHFRAQLKQRGASASQQIESAHQQALHAIQPYLNALYQALQKALEGLAKGAKIPLSWLYEGHKLADIQQAIMNNISHFSGMARTVTTNLVAWASDLGAQAGHSFLNAVSSASSSASSVANKIIGGIHSLFDGMAGAASQSVRDALSIGVSLAQPIATLARGVGQALDVSRWRSLTILDTSIFKAFNQSATDVYAGQTDKYMWICQLTTRSCAACVALHGTIHDLDEEINEHPGGSCIKVPFFADSPDVQSGQDWFKSQDESTQKAIIGTNVGYQLYKSGQASLSDFVGINHDHEYGDTLYQLSAKAIQN